MSTILMEQLSKHYGKKQALHEVNLAIGTGMYGLIGQNGAGKTTLMRILTTLLPKSSGKVTICGIPIEKASTVRPLIGYLPQDFSLYPSMKVWDALDYLGLLSGMDKKARKERIPYLLEQVNLMEVAYLRVKALSGGMKRRLGVVQALLHDPPVIIVDEPTAGLDPNERVRIRNLLCGIAQTHTVVLSTHIVEDIEKTCNQIGILSQGHLCYNGSIKDFTNGRDLENAYLSFLDAAQKEGGAL